MAWTIVVVTGIWASVVWFALALMWPDIKRWRAKHRQRKERCSNGVGCYMCGGEYTKLKKRGTIWLCRDRKLCQETCRLRGLLESMP